MRLSRPITLGEALGLHLARVFDAGVVAVIDQHGAQDDEEREHDDCRDGDAADDGEDVPHTHAAHPALVRVVDSSLRERSIVAVTGDSE